MKRRSNNDTTLRPIGSILLLQLLFLLFQSNIVITTAYDQTRKEGTNNAGGAFGPRSHILLRVENYLYETNKYNGNFKSNNNNNDVELKMVLAQELHEEPLTTTALDGNGDDDGGDDHRNSTETGNTNLVTTAVTSPATTIVTTTTISYNNNSNKISNNNPLGRLYTRIWNRLDELDRMIVSSTLPLAALTCIMPLVATNDLFWVNQLGEALAVSAQSAVNMVYQMSFGLFSFLPSVTATLVSQHYANGDVEGTQSVIGQSTMLAMLASSVISSLLFFNPDRFLGAVLKDGNPALEMSKSILRIRCLSLMPQVLSFVAFSAFRGTMDLKSCVKISVISNALNMVLTPILIHVFRFGVSGSALATLLCDCLTALSYIKLMTDRRFLIPGKIFTFPSWEQMAPLLKGSALQARSLAMHSTNLLVARKIQSLDSNGVAPAAFALAMQTFFMGSVILFAMGMATQTLYPTAIANSPDEHRTEFRRVLVQRLLNRGFGLGITVSFIQCLLAPGILRSTPLKAVRQAAIFPILVVIAFQGINGVANVGEGIIIGSGKFALASAILVTASLGYMGLVQLTPTRMGINGIFLCMAAYNLLRLGGVLAFLPTVVKDDTPKQHDTLTRSISEP